MTTIRARIRDSVGWAVTASSAALLALTLAACGGSSGGDGGVAGQQPGAPTSISDVSRGPIDGFGSLIMNGRTFITGAFTDVEDDDSRSLADLEEGMEVEIHGGLDDNGNLTAGVVRVEEAVKGKVTQAIGTGAPLMVLGQTINTTNAIVDDSIVGGLAGLDTDDELEVHGSVAPGSAPEVSIIDATFIEVKQNLLAYNVKGIVANLDADSFTIGALTVMYTLAVVDDDVDLADGAFVEVKSAPPDFTMATMTLVATDVESDAIDAADDVELEVEGFVTSAPTAPNFAAGDSFLIGAQEVQTSASTQFLGGMPADLLEGVKVEAEGRAQNGALLARKVKFKESIRLEGDVENFDELNSSFNIKGLDGIEVRFDSFTELDDDDFPLGDGAHVEIRGREINDSSTDDRVVMAFRLRTRGSRSDVELQAAVEAIAGSAGAETLTILGVVVSTADFQDQDDSPGDSDFEGENDQDLTRGQFFSLAEVGSVVKVKGDLSGNEPPTVDWDGVELEGEDD